jgi:hypothetical protein
MAVPDPFATRRPVSSDQTRPRVRPLHRLVMAIAWALRAPFVDVHPPEGGRQSLWRRAQASPALNVIDVLTEVYGQHRVDVIDNNASIYL